MLTILFVWVQTSLSLAQSFHFDAFDHMKDSYIKSKINSRGLTGQIGLSVPFGHLDKGTKKAFYGFKMTYGQEMRNSNPFKYGYTRDLNLFQSGFSKNGLNSMSLANRELIFNGEQKNVFGNGNGNGSGLLWGIALVGVGLGACWALGCFDGNDSSSSDTSSN